MAKTNNWRRLDNSAKIFPIASSKKYSSVFRLSAVLKEKIEPKILKEAVNRVLKNLNSFKVKLKKGVFWYYFEENNKEIIIKYASYNLRNNKEIAEIAIKQDKRAYDFITEELQQDEEIKKIIE